VDAVKLFQIAAMLGAEAIGGDPLITGFSTDSRKLEPGQLFFALSGERFDGHDFLSAAREAGAAAAVVERPGDWGVPYVVVANARLALGALARALRLRLPAKLIGVTGSNGKTTVKEMLASILRQVGPTLFTEGNLNNDIGVPLTLFRLRPEHAFGVIEMGANHLREIDYLARVALPDVGLVNNAGRAHLEGFGSEDGVAQGKGEMFAALPSHGIAVINADDRYAPLWRQLAGERRVIDFGIDKPAAVRAEAIAGSRFLLKTLAGEAPVELPVPGRHNIMNALAAAAAATALDVPPSVIASGLAATPRVKGRLNWWPGVNGSRVLDDTYNANPNSLRAGLDVLAAEPGERWLVLGDMAELGADAAALHAQAGEWALAAGVRRLFAVGKLAGAAAERFGCGGTHYPDKTALVSAIQATAKPGVSILVKGSRSMRMEQVVADLAAPAADKGGN
jgi:UDP-N-acetylmuramoyl-tripeptide--D-alanyl-D-alanine ligase